MVFVERPLPEFSWSHSRDRTLAECPRKYYWNYYGSWNGWRSDAPQEARDAYLCKQLTSLPLELGSRVHECARAIALALKQGRPRPTYEEMLESVRADLRALCTRDRAEFLRRPKQNPIPQGVFYRGRLKSGEAQRVAERMETCLRALCAAPIWDELAACEPRQILVADALDTFPFEGLQLYAAPDLFYYVDDTYWLVDWKTGSEEGVEEQLALYALYARQKFNLSFTEGRWKGRVINLAEGSDRVLSIRRADLIAAVDRIRGSVGRMHALLEDAEANRPRPRAAFPMVDAGQRWRCQQCNFLLLCKEELDRPVPPTPHAPASPTL